MENLIYNSPRDDTGLIFICLQLYGISVVHPMDMIKTGIFRILRYLLHILSVWDPALISGLSP
jgi:hypothetical protein